METLLLTLAITGATTTASFAAFDGNKLQEFCKNDNSAIGGYIVGASAARDNDLATLEFIEGINDDLFGKMERKPSYFVRANVCLPDATTIGDQVGMFCKFLDLNPGKRDTAGYHLLLEALEEVWPCEVKK